MANKKQLVAARTPQKPSVEEADKATLSADEFTRAHGVSLDHALDLDNWHLGEDLVAIYQRHFEEISQGIEQERKTESTIRTEILPKLCQRKGAPPNAGVHRVKIQDLEDIHRKLLFNGGVEACDGTVTTHDTLPVTITQIGVCLVSYQGNQGSWAHRLYRSDLRTSWLNPIEETWDLLERRSQRSALEVDDSRDVLTSLARRGIMAYAERAALMDRSQAVWRMGHGSPTPYELVTGSGMPELLRAGLALMKRLIEYKKIVFVPSAIKARHLLMIGNALKPLEYVIIDDNQTNLERVGAGHYRGQEWGDLGKRVADFAKEFGPQIVIGMYRASYLAPCQMFYAHVEFAHQAALIAMADSLLQEHRGFPMLIDLADSLCATTLGADTFSAWTQLAYSEAGEPYRYMAERRTRQR